MNTNTFMRSSFLILVLSFLAVSHSACGSLEGPQGRTAPPNPDDGSSNDQAPLLEVVVLDGDVPLPPWYNTECGCFATGGISLREAVSLAALANEVRVVGSTSLLEKELTIGIIIPQEAEDGLYQRMFIEALKGALGLSFSPETQDMDVYVLTAPDGAVSVLHPHDLEAHRETWDGGQVMSQVSLSGAFYFLEDQLNAIIVDETNLSGEYSFRLEWNAGEPESLIAAVQDQLGLLLTPARRTVNVLVVEEQ